MLEFDGGTERCYDCDGHFRHFAPCPLFREDDPRNSTSLFARLAVHTILNEVLEDAE